VGKVGNEVDAEEEWGRLGGGGKGRGIGRKLLLFLLFLLHSCSGELHLEFCAQRTAEVKGFSFSSCSQEGAARPLGLYDL